MTLIIPKILVVSDSHGSLGPLVELVDKENPRTLIHLGDLVDKGGEESDKRDHHILMKLLREHKSLRLIHVDGGEDSYGPFELQVQNSYRKRAFTGRHYSEGRYFLSHKVCYEAHADINLFGHTHRQMYKRGDYDYADEGIVLGREYSIKGKGPFFINPGAFRHGEYCIIAEDTLLFKNL
ncbi:metallophosphoesterase family protein [Candidatus Woesearchaeota archaeon]|nr:metallophosphoesterase family protein [Candidatus Woesearchaeota archaeon]